MRKGGGRAKGNGFENKIAKMIVKEFHDFGIRRKHCYRTPGSGGHRQARNTDPGDLVIHRKLRKLFPYCVECKFYKSIDLWNLFLSFRYHVKSSKFKTWLKQVCTAAKRTHQIPLLIFKKNNADILCALPYDSKLDHSPVLKFKYKHKTWIVLKFKSLIRYLVKEHSHGTK